MIGKLDIASVRAVTDEIAGMPTGTRNEVQIKRIYVFG